MQTPPWQSRIMRKGEGEQNPSPNSAPTFISSDSEGCVAVRSMATVSRKSGAARSAGSEDFQSVRSSARQNSSLAGFTASAGASGRGYDVGKHPPQPPFMLMTWAKAASPQGWITGQVPRHGGCLSCAPRAWAPALSTPTPRLTPQEHPAICLVCMRK